MNIKTMIEDLMNNKIYLDFNENEKGYYLVHLFSKLDPKLNSEKWEIGFFNPESKKMVSFLMGEEVELRRDEEIAMIKDTIDELKLGEVFLEFEEAIEIAKEIQERKYSGQRLSGGFIILQNLDGEVIWNITFSTAFFGMLNIKIDVVTRKVVSDKLTTFFDLREKK